MGPPVSEALSSVPKIKITVLLTRVLEYLRQTSIIPVTKSNTHDIIYFSVADDPSYCLYYLN